MGSRDGSPLLPDGPATAGVVAAFLGAGLEGVGQADVPGLDPAAVELTGVSHDSRTVAPGDLFCCVVGSEHDGHDFAPSAVDSGAAALLVQRTLDIGVPQLVVTDVRAAMADAAAVVYGDPSSKLTVLGVTGTNGKTTVVSMLGAILADAGHSVEVIGTLTGARTTPEAPELTARLAELLDSGVTHVAMEVSSHALELGRVDSIHFAAAVFTNLGADHLDFHGTQEAYFRAKAKLFEAGRSDVAVLNIDDPRGRLLRDSSEIQVVPYSLDDARELQLDVLPTRFRWRGQEVSLSMPGEHNVYNALAAAETAVAIGVPAPQVAESLSRVPQVPGRFELVDPPQDGSVTGVPTPTVVVDFAHTPDALEAALRAARGMAGESAAVWVVFGCGGDRDRDKRPRMGAVASSAADHVVVTNDNPRSEDPLSIIDAVRAGCVGEPIVEADRRRAIETAVSRAEAGDVVLIAGKGHEQGQVFADHTDPFDDREVAREALARSVAGAGGGT